MTEDRGQAARNAGILLLLTALATGVSVMARISADADQPTLEESLRAIATNTGMYTLGGVARILSGAVLAAAAGQVWRSTVIREGLGGPLVPYLLVASGVITAASGVCALVLAASVGDTSEVAATATTEAVSTLRWVTGKLGFTAGGAGANGRGAASVDRFAGDCRGVGGDWPFDAADMGGRCDDRAPDLRQRLLRVAGGDRRDAAAGNRGTPPRRHARLALSSRSRLP